jgi:hypothetical protein
MSEAAGGDRFDYLASDPQRRRVYFYPTKPAASWGKAPVSWLGAGNQPIMPSNLSGFARYPGTLG